MLPRRFRITRPEDFQLVRQRGKHWRGEVLSVSVLATEPADLRFGFVVGRQVGSAAVRNRLKRRLREIVHKQIVHLNPGYSVVIIARPPARDLSFHELDLALRKLLSAAGLLAAENGGSTL